MKPNKKSDAGVGFLFGVGRDNYCIKKGGGFLDCALTRFARNDKKRGEVFSRDDKKESNTLPEMTKKRVAFS